ncbi:MAG: hypothetical protein HW390_1090, partial [Candidatus Brocadiaceae bacterium]|nr:hypothetical protein [Candidatus Brocadiaceae bacterium]
MSELKAVCATETAAEGAVTTVTDTTYPWRTPCLMNLFTLQAIAAKSTCKR